MGVLEASPGPVTRAGLGPSLSASCGGAGRRGPAAGRNLRAGMARAYNAIADALRSVVLDTTADAEALHQWTAAATGAIALLNRKERGRA